MTVEVDSVLSLQNKNMLCKKLCKNVILQRIWLYLLLETFLKWWAYIYYYQGQISLHLNTGKRPQGKPGWRHLLHCPWGGAWVITGVHGVGGILGLNQVKAGTRAIQALPHVPLMLVDFLPWDNYKSHVHIFIQNLQYHHRNSSHLTANDSITRENRAFQSLAMQGNDCRVNLPTYQTDENDT